MSIRGWGVMALLLGGLALLGADNATSGDGRMVWGGGIVFAGGIVLLALGTWEEFTRQRQQRLDKEQVVPMLERLARLREQGVLTEEEFASQKQKILDAEVDDECSSE